MKLLDDLLHAIIGLLLAFFGILLGLLDALEGLVARPLAQAGFSPIMRDGVFVLVAVVFLIAVLRLFGGLIRVGLVLFLVLLLLHAVTSPRGDGRDHPVPEQGQAIPAGTR